MSEAEHLLTYNQDDQDWIIFKIQVRGDRWVSYDDEHSVRLKAEFAFDKKLAGVMVWSVETDDFKVDITSIVNNKNNIDNVKDKMLQLWLIRVAVSVLLVDVQLVMLFKCSIGADVLKMAGRKIQDPRSLCDAA